VKCFPGTYFEAPDGQALVATTGAGEGVASSHWHSPSATSSSAPKWYRMNPLSLRSSAAAADLIFSRNAAGSRKVIVVSSSLIWMDEYHPCLTVSKIILIVFTAKPKRSVVRSVQHDQLIGNT
jgi:hypothetical protein